MEKSLQNKKFTTVRQDKSAANDPLYKMQQQLNTIEKKLDSLIYQVQKSSRSFSNHQGRDGVRHGNVPTERTYTQAVCSECKKECEIPFKPTGGRPVYCSECFSKTKQGASVRSSRDNRFEERTFAPKRRPTQKKRTIKGKMPSFALKKTGRKKRT